MKRLFPVLSIVAVILLAYALYLALVVAPTDAMQGNVYRIIYYHVPSAWTAFLLFFINFVASVRYLVRSKASLERSANWIAAAIGVVGVIAPFLPPVRKLIPAGMEPGAVATTIVLVPVFYFLVGKWWAPGDIRLTSTLVLWLIYVSYLVLRRFSNSAQTQMLAAALAVFGALDVPLVYLSIWFFRTQHPQPVIGGGGSMDPRMLHILLFSWLAFLLFGFLVCWSRFRLELLQREVEQAHAMESMAGGAESVKMSLP